MPKITITAITLTLWLGACGTRAPAPPPAPVPPPPPASTELAAAPAAPGAPPGVVRPAPTVVLLDLQAATDLNPTPDGRAAPLRLRLYELRRGTAFGRADYFALVESPQGSLAADLVDQDELLIQPGQHRRLERRLAEPTRLLGLVAAYRDLDGAVWRLLIEVPAGQTSRHTIRLGRRALVAGSAP
ncbi:type VI secretion system protein VasD [Azotobacter beijerinckii]|uniref:Type VI secretion system protein VasD n=1 Tax=Azotobacter beijerinckii TaxID=170623 RepID=A0A1H9A3R9_9GAMM|nr:type VI secretion system lipoprotein TssJ [Azotobacter beijerinckii]SEP71265.1 type VI secretion system protein VasD [Azotobacter beijerinckii]